MHKAEVTFNYQSSFDSNNVYNDILPSENITMKFPAQDLNVNHYFTAFKNFLFSIGFTEDSILNGSVSILLSPSISDEKIDNILEQYDAMTLDRHLELVRESEKEFEANKKKLQDEIKNLQKVNQNLSLEILKVKAVISRLENPDCPNYTDEEIEAMSAEVEYDESDEVTVDTLRNAYQVCPVCGDKYGVYSVGCSSHWFGKCDVCKTEGVAVTEVRDYGYLHKGIKELQK